MVASPILSEMTYGSDLSLRMIDDDVNFIEELSCTYRIWLKTVEVSHRRSISYLRLVSSSSGKLQSYRKERSALYMRAASSSCAPRSFCTGSLRILNSFPCDLCRYSRSFDDFSVRVIQSFLMMCVPVV